jgi:flagellar basal body-associated protein FliL
VIEYYNIVERYCLAAVHTHTAHFGQRGVYMKKGIIIGVAVAAVIAIAAVVMLVVLPSLKGGENPGDEQAIKEKFEYKLGEMYTNIADEGRVAKVSIAIEYSLTDEEVKTAEKEHPASGGHGETASAGGPLDVVFEDDVSKIKTNIYKIFREKTFADLSKPNSVDRLQEEIRQVASEATGIAPETISDVYFLEYFVQ